MVKLLDEFIGWNLSYTVPLFQFEFTFILPRPRKERFIAIRDSLGRILRSEVPLMQVE